LWGLNSLIPRIGYFLIFKKYVKTIKLTIKPHPSTNKSDGFQSVPNDKNLIILDRRTIPATNKPNPNIKPTKKTINWSIII
jgi:hypothetical protein